jgi:hypothetical protein
VSPRAYDLVGDIALPAEVFPRLAALEKMADTLDAAGNFEAAAETRDFLNESRAFATLADVRLRDLRAIWKAMENGGESPLSASRRPEDSFRQQLVSTEDA